MPDYLFAYGTLLPGAAPAEISGAAARLKAVGEGQVCGLLYDLGHFPGAALDGSGYEFVNTAQINIAEINDQNGGQNKSNNQNQVERVIYGTVFELPRDPEILATLDAYEEFDPENAAASQFLRTRCVASLASGTAIECWVYVYNRGIKNIPVVEGGRWNPGKVSA
jgi:gamma-glutamylcyclotransferase (GGCT)/AIG2-like uncharacterized protein YtfP